MINSCIGTDKTEFVFNDDRADAGAEHLTAFLKNQFNDAWVFLGLFCQIKRSLRRRDRSEVYCPPFGFADDLLGDNENVAILNLDICLAQTLDNNIRQVVVSADKGKVL